MICLTTNVILRRKKLQFVKIKLLSLLRVTLHIILGKALKTRYSEDKVVYFT